MRWKLNNLFNKIDLTQIAYKVEDKIIKSCWKVNKLGITVIRNQKEWNERIKII